MDKTIFTLMFLASGPIALMPTAIALFTKKSHRIAICGLNILVWLGLYFLLQDVVVSGSGTGLAVPVPLAIALWLILLKIAVSADGATRSSEREPGAEHVPNKRVQATRDARAPDA